MLGKISKQTFFLSSGLFVIAIWLIFAIAIKRSATSDIVQLPEIEWAKIIDQHPNSELDIDLFDPANGTISGCIPEQEPLESVSISPLNGGIYIYAQPEISGNHFRFTDLPAQQYAIEIVDEHYNKAHKSIYLMPGENYEFETGSRVLLTMAFRTKENEPLPPQDVYLEIEIVPDGRGHDKTKKLIHLNTDGEASVEVRAGQTFQVTAITTQSGGVFKKSITVPQDASTPFRTELQVESWPEITGCVTNTAGAAILGASVALWDISNEEYPRPLQQGDHSETRELYGSRLSTSTDDQGQFRFTLPPHQRAILAFFGEHYPIVTLEGLEAGSEPIDVQLQTPLGSLRVIPKVTSGTPREYWWSSLFLINIEEPDKRLGAVHTSADTALFPTLQPGTYELGYNGFKTADYYKVIIEKDKASTITVNVENEDERPRRDIEYTRPPAKPQLTVKGRFKTADGSPPPKHAILFHYNGRGEVDADGNYRFGVYDKNRTFSPYDTDVFTPGYIVDQEWRSQNRRSSFGRNGRSISENSLEIQENETIEEKVPIRLCPTAVLHGRIVSATGVPMERVSIKILNKEIETVTDRDGRYMLNAPDLNYNSAKPFSTIVTTKHDSYADACFVIEGLEQGYNYQLEDIQLAPAQEATLKITYEDRGQKYLFNVEQGWGYKGRLLSLKNTVYNGGMISFAGNSFLIAHPKLTDYSYLSLMNPNDISRHLLPGIVISPKPGEKNVRIKIPEDLVRKVRFQDANGNRLRNAEVHVTGYEQRHNYLNLLNRRSPSMLMPVAEYQTKTNYHGEVYLYLSEEYLTQILVEQPSTGNVKSFMSSGGSGGEPKDAFYPQSGKERLDLTAKPTSNSNYWAALPE